MKVGATTTFYSGWKYFATAAGVSTFNSNTTSAFSVTWVEAASSTYTSVGFAAIAILASNF
jgi:hypothetical protein